MVAHSPTVLANMEKATTRENPLIARILSRKDLDFCIRRTHREEHHTTLNRDCTACVGSNTFTHDLSFSSAGHTSGLDDTRLSFTRAPPSIRAASSEA